MGFIALFDNPSFSQRLALAGQSSSFSTFPKTQESDFFSHESPNQACVFSGDCIMEIEHIVDKANEKKPIIAWGEIRLTQVFTKGGHFKLVFLTGGKS